METIIKLAGKIIDHIAHRSLDWAKKTAERKPQLLKILKALGLSKLEATGESVYCHSLMEFSTRAEQVEIVQLFGEKKVIEAFLNDKIETGADQLTEVLKKAIGEDKHSVLCSYFNGDFFSLEPSIKEFRQLYEAITFQTANPFQLKMYNDMMDQLLTLAEEFERNRHEKELKSFDYQARKYTETLISDFEKAFPAKTDKKGKGPYIDLNGETRVYIPKRKERLKHDDEPEAHLPVAEEKEDREWKENYTSIEHRPLDEFINRWLADDRRRFLLIVGEYGTGKTTFLQYMAHQLATNRENEKNGPGTAIYDTDKRLPLYFPLREFEKDIESFILTRLNRDGIEDINYRGFLDRLKNRELILLLDGFDEMTQRIDADEKKRNFAKIRGLIEHSSASKIILTVRYEYFRSLEGLRDVIKYEGKSDEETVYLMAFDDGQIQRYLESRIDNPGFYWEHIENTFDLKDLAKRPVLLQLIVDHLPKVIAEKGDDRPVNASDLYRHCIQAEMERKSNDLPFTIPNRCRLDILERLAVWMFIQDVLDFNILLLEEELDFKRYFPGKTPYEIEKYLNEFLTFSFLIREGHNRFRMSHKSFRDYLTAVSFVREINSDQIESFGKNQITDEINHFIIEQKPNQKMLLYLIESARELPSVKRFQGGNGCNILLGIDRTALKGRDLSGCQLTGVNFSYCDLTGIDFSQAELRSCWFDKRIIKTRYTDIDAGESFLNLWGCQLKEIDFIKSFHGLSSLNLSFNQLTDVSALSELKGLKTLNISSNQLTDVNVMSELKNLTELDLSDNQMTDVRVLSELKGLTTLNISSNQLTDVNAMSELKGLTILDISSNQLTKVSALSELKGLTILDISSNQLTDVSALSELTGLTELRLSNNKLTDVSALSELTGLTELRLSNNKLTDVSILSELKGLTMLDISNNQLTNVSALPELKGLTYLDLSINQLTGVSALSELKGLTYLDLSNNQLTGVSALSELTGLIELRLSNNKLIDVSALSELKGLTMLDISNNQLTDVSALSGLNGLTKLRLYSNKLTDVSSLSELKKLLELSLRNNQLTDVSALSELKKLEYLYLDKKQKSILDRQLDELKNQIPGLEIYV